MIGKKRTGELSMTNSETLKQAGIENAERMKRQCRIEKEKLKQTSQEVQNFSDDDNEESKHENIELEDDEWKIDNEELREHLKIKTRYYMDTYKEIKQDLDFTQYPLKNYSKVQISNFIKKERSKLNLEGKKQSESEKVPRQNMTGGKRSHEDGENINRYQRPNKRQKLEKDLALDLPRYQMARFLINNMTLYDDKLQIDCMQTLETLINQNKHLHSTTQVLMVQQYSKEAKAYYEARDLKSLTNLFSSIDPMLAILINIEISLTNQNYTEESSTLSETLLPFINKTEDYSFLTDESSYIMSRFVKSLTNHIIDTQCQIKAGFIICSLKYEPTKLKTIIGYQQNRSILRSALISLQFPLEISSFISENYTKLLWPLLLNNLKGLTDKVAIECLKILSKISILSDPGPHISQLIDYFASRQLIVDELLKVPTINIGLQVLIRVIEFLVLQTKESIIHILTQDSTKWEVLSMQQVNKVDVMEVDEKQVDYQALYETLIANSEKKIDLKQLQEISRNISSEIEIYKHCDYQTCIAAAILSYDSPHIIATAPTGSGKTWVQGLIAKYFCLQNQSVTIVEPNKQLKSQTAEKLGMVDFGIAIVSIEEYYLYGTKDNIVILNEYDMVLEQYPYLVQEGNLSGLWNFKGKKIIAFSATTSLGFERLFNSCIGKPTITNFKSEYEIKQGISPIQEPRLVYCHNNEPIAAYVIKDIEQNYDLKPIVIIYEGNQVDDYVNYFNRNKYKYVRDVQENSLLQIQQWDSGILLLEKSLSRGIDTRFRIDSLVMIVCEVKNYNELQQMVGRSSRQRGVCQSIYYTVKQETNSQWIQRLKRQGLEELQDLERLMLLFEKKQQDSVLQKTLLNAKQKGIDIKCLGDVQKLTTSAQFGKMTKGVFQ